MRNTLSKEKRREVIFQSAIELFLTHGYENVTISQVIAKSDVARGTFYLHFASLETLLIEWFDTVIQQTWAQIEPYLDNLSIPVDACTHHVVHAVFELYTANPSMAKVFFCGGGASFMQVRHEAMYEKLGSKLYRAIQLRHPEQGHGHEAQWTVAMLIGMIGEMANYANHYVQPTRLESFKDRVASFAVAGLTKHLEMAD